MSVKVKGDRALQAVLERLKSSIKDEDGQEAILKAAEPMRDKARRLAPRDEGDLRKSITLGLADDGKVHLGIDETQDSRLHIYAGIQEYGSKSRPARPYMRPAMRTEQGSIPGDVGPVVWKVVQEKSRG